jgi:hypothetical protein
MVDGAGAGDFQEIPYTALPEFGTVVLDIYAEIEIVSEKGLKVVDGILESLKDKLVHVSFTFNAFRDPERHYHWPGDDLEAYAGAALTAVDMLLQESPLLPLPPKEMRDLKTLQRLVQDLVVLSHSRYLDQTMLQVQGIPMELRSRIEATFGGGSDPALWSRLGNSKFHLFTEGWSFRKARRRRDKRPLASLDLGEPQFLDLLDLSFEHIPADNTVAKDAASSPTCGRAIFLVDLKKNDVGFGEALVHII